MKKTLRWTGLLALALVAFGSVRMVHAVEGDAQPALTPAETTGTQSLEIEKLRLEKENLELEIEKLKLQATLGPSTTTKTEHVSKAEKKENLDRFQADYSDQAKALSLQHKDEADLLVADFVNSEMWYKGTRYGINEWEALAGNQGWKFSKTVDSRDPGGHARNLYKYRNVSLLRYEGRKQGILIFKAPLTDGDLRLLTPESLTFASKQEDVRNAFKNDYFEFDKQRRDKKGMFLRYVHSMKWQFDEKIEIFFDNEGKMVNLRYGVLDER